VPMVAPKAPRTVARPASPECTTVEPMAVPTGVPMVAPTGEPQNGAFKF
jgi:hypothetical protein